jgi:hypothetical protein
MEDRYIVITYTTYPTGHSQKIRLRGNKSTFVFPVRSVLKRERIPRSGRDRSLEISSLVAPCP